MTEIMIVNYKPWHHVRSQQPRNFAQLCDMICADPVYAGKPKGIREYIETDVQTGQVLRRMYNMNVLLDIGAQSLLQRGINSSSASLPLLFNNILITNNSGSTTLSTGLTISTTYTALPVAALPAAIPATIGGVATQLTIGYGSGQTQNCQVSGAAVQGATSISITAVGGGTFTANATYAAGAAVVPNPNVAENPTAAQLIGNVTASLVSYSGNLPTSAFTFTPTSGNGNRTDVISFIFNTSANSGTTPVGNYTDGWIVNVASGATTNNYMAHDINVPLTCNNSVSLTANMTISI